MKRNMCLTFTVDNKIRQWIIISSSNNHHDVENVTTSKTTTPNNDDSSIAHRKKNNHIIYMQIIITTVITMACIRHVHLHLFHILFFFFQMESSHWKTEYRMPNTFGVHKIFHFRPFARKKILFIFDKQIHMWAHLWSDANMTLHCYGSEFVHLCKLAKGGKRDSLLRMLRMMGR